MTSEQPLSRTGRRVRLIAAAVVFALITVGTVHGTDDAFPFGPLRMYSTRDNPNGVVSQGVVLAITTTGRSVDVTNTSGAPRRAELEGRFAEFSADPASFGRVATAYVHDGDRLRGSTDRVQVVELVRRKFPLHNGRSGAPVDQILASWRPPS
jgi:hypothetical protein